MTTPEDMLRLKRAVEAAGDDAAAAERALAILGRESPALAGVARRALQTSAEMGDFLMPPHASAVEHVSSQAMLSATVARRIGPYRLLRPLGAGGMGAVFYAIRDDGAFDQEVAIKVTRPDIRSERLLARFERERRLLARLDHPNIARMFDGGATDDGEQYLVMEHVDGDAIDVWCRERRLSRAERVQLFLPICASAQCAHERMVVHGDIKPANILVGRDGVPKLVDFGVSRSATDEETEPVDREGAGPTLGAGGTPGYASPEQLSGAPLRPASDVYSLGATLNELLGGESAQDRDLRAIVARATAMDPAARYSAAIALAEDLGRWLRGEPVAARRRTPMYVAKKWAGRHRRLIAGAAGVVICATAATAVIWAAQNRAAAARRDAGTARAMAAEAEQRSQRVAEILSATIGSLEPGETAEGSMSVAARTLERRLAQLADQPLVEADVRIALARMHIPRWEWGHVATHLERAVALLRAHGRRGDLTPFSETLTLLGRAKAHMGEISSVPIMEEAVGVEQTLHGPLHPRTAAAVGALGYALWCDRASQDLGRAEKMYRRSLDIFGQGEARHSPDHARVLMSYAMFLDAQSRPEEAEERLTQAADMFRALPPTRDRYRAECMSMLAGFRLRDERYSEAEALMHAWLEATPHGAHDDSVSRGYWRLCITCTQQGRHEEAIDWALEGFKEDLLLLGLANPSSLTQAAELRGRLASREAPIAALLIDAFNVLRASEAPPVRSISRLCFAGEVLSDGGHHADAEAVLRECDARASQDLPPEHVRAGIIRCALGQCLALQGRRDEAAPLLARAADELAVSVGGDHKIARLARQRAEANANGTTHRAN